jgi:RNA polymerase sigma-70 factor (ECF subfamily)
MTDNDDFESFMRNYQGMVYSTALRLLANEADALDISQEVFLKAHQHYRDLCRNHRAAGWLKTVTTNLSLNHLSRYRSRWRFFSEMFEPDSEGADSLASSDSHHEQIDADHRRDVLQRALQSLPAAQRVPLVLYHFEDMSYDEIARQLGISLSKVKVDIHRGREALRTKLQSADLPDTNHLMSASSAEGTKRF